MTGRGNAAGTGRVGERRGRKAGQASGQHVVIRRDDDPRRPFNMHEAAAEARRVLFLRHLASFPSSCRIVTLILHPLVLCKPRPPLLQPPPPPPRARAPAAALAGARPAERESERGGWCASGLERPARSRPAALTRSRAPSSQHLRPESSCSHSSARSPRQSSSLRSRLRPRPLVRRAGRGGRALGQGDARAWQSLSLERRSASSSAACA
eukprot:219686-Rhodomonas_salina.1